MNAKLALLSTAVTLSTSLASAQSAKVSVIRVYSEDTHVYKVYNNTPLLTDWIFAEADIGALPMDKLYRVEDIKPGTGITWKLPTMAGQDGRRVGYWGTVDPTNTNANNVVGYLNALSGIIPQDKWDDISWYYEADIGEPEWEITLPKRNRDLIDGDADPIYLKLHYIQHGDYEEIQHPLCRWINAGATLKERSERAEVYAKALEDTMFGITAALANGQKIGKPTGTPVPAWVLGLQVDDANGDWQGVKIEKVLDPTSLWGDQLPWEAGDTILELNGQPLFNRWQLYTILDRHVRGPGIEQPLTAIVEKENGERKQYLATYRYNEEFFKHHMTAAQARRFVALEDSLWGPIIRTFNTEVNGDGQVMTYEQKNHFAKESKMMAYQMYPEAAEEGAWASWIIPSPLRVVSIAGKAGKVGRAATKGTRGMRLIREVGITATEAAIGTYQEPTPLDNPELKKAAAGRAITSAIAFDWVFDILTRRR